MDRMKNKNRSIPTPQLNSTPSEKQIGIARAQSKAQAGQASGDLR